jgi:hypothetical protein
MAGRQTTLCIVNTTEMDIEGIHIPAMYGHHWAGSARPTQGF